MAKQKTLVGVNEEALSFIFQGAPSSIILAIPLIFLVGGVEWQDYICTEPDTSWPIEG